MTALHATAVAIAGEAVLIRGASRAGKSRLAFALLARSTRQRQIVLVGDDRVLLQEAPDGLLVAPHPRIAGFMERRGLGIVALPWCSNVPVGGSICIGAVSSEPSLAGLPSVEIAVLRDVEACATHALAWWARDAAARAPHLPRKACPRVRSRAKD